MPAQGARTSASPCSRAAALRAGESAPGHIPPRPSSASTPTATARSPAAWWCATRPLVRAARPLRVRRPLPRPDRVGAPERQQAAQGAGHAPAGGQPVLVRRGRPAVASTRPRSAARSTGSSRVERRSRRPRRRPRRAGTTRARSRSPAPTRGSAGPLGLSTPGPALDAHLDAVAAAVGAKGGRGHAARTTTPTTPKGSTRSRSPVGRRPRSSPARGGARRTATWYGPLRVLGLPGPPPG